MPKPRSALGPTGRFRYRFQKQQIQKALDKLDEIKNPKKVLCEYVPLRDELEAAVKVSPTTTLNPSGRAPGLGALPRTAARGGPTASPPDVAD